MIRPSRTHIRFDWAAKKMLRDKANFGILEGFLSELLKDKIKINSILESESNKESDDDKYNRVDLLVQNSKNELIIIEIQNTRELDYLYRLLYITSKTISENIKVGEPYSAVVRIITISVLYFDLGQGNDYIYRGNTHFTGLHSNDLLQLSEGQKKFFLKENISQIFPEHYLIRISQFDENKISFNQDKFDEWIYFLKTSEIKDNFTAQGLDEARKKLTIMNMPSNEQRAYQHYLDKISTEASIAETLKFEAEEARRASEEAIRIAEETIRNGEETIRKEEKKQIAKTMLEKGYAIEEIALLTGLPSDFILSLRNN